MNNTENNISIRDFYAAEILKALILAQSKRRMTLINRLKWWLGGNGCMGDWKAHYDYNFKHLAEKALEFADDVLQERNREN
jgi:hypothetical protein